MSRMKNMILPFLLIIVFSLSGYSQEVKLKSGFGIGFQINQYQKDFGLGFQLNSPYFVQNRLTIRLRGNIMFFEHSDRQTGKITWTNYTNFTLGIAGIGGYVSDRIRVYGEGGMVMLLPHFDFSSEQAIFGGYGLFGFEFFMSEAFNYFIELGGVGTGARADELPFAPIFSNGFLASVGFRKVF